MNIVEGSKENGVILIGIRVSESSSWSKIIEQLNVDDLINKKAVDLLFFRIGDDYRLDIFDQLKVMLSGIDDKY
jgi:hypothetical protein